MAKVLILDQSKSMRNTLRERLEYEGFSTEAAEDEEAASNMCEKIPFDVILSDTGCKIPDKGVPFIVLSSEASIDSAVEAVRNGAQDYLTKPIDMNRLLQSIHRTIDDPAPVPAPAAAPARRTRRGHNAQDIPLLVDHFIRTICAEYHIPAKRIEEEALSELQTMPWSGNIRELRNVIERLIILSEERITPADVKAYC